MATYRDVAVAGGQIAGGFQKMGFMDKVHILLSPNDGHRLEAAFHAHAKFTNVTLPNGTTFRTR
jgi:hypothetical protein